MIIRKAVLLINSSKENIKLVCNTITGILSSHCIKTDIIDLYKNNKEILPDIKEIDLAVSIGGDGTVLSCVSFLKETLIPIIAVNMGTFGYITATETGDFEKVLEELLNDSAQLSSRMMIDVSVVRDRKEIFKSSALNDIVISSDGVAKLIKMDLFINNELASNIRADGLIFSTPTGSTAYNLSAGGPILEPSLDCIVINPICAFSMNVRPLVVSASSEVKVRIPVQRSPAMLTSDGFDSFDLMENDIINITKSKFSINLVRNKNRNAISILRDKLSWSESYGN